MYDAQTIAAIATPPGVSAIAIVRLSGPRAHDIARACFIPRRDATIATAKLTRGWVCDPKTGERIDDALAAFFFAPRSFTGEDLVELHVHGGLGVLLATLAVVLAAGARLAEAGEFSKRAFVNGRLDLAQAEAVADLIAAESARAAAAAAHRLASGGAVVAELRAELLDRLVEIEAHVDYPDEVGPPDPERLAASVATQIERVDQMLVGAREARALRDGVACVIAGPPNAGKSSLLNALLQAERAIVSDIPGTTRDIIEDRAVVDGVPVRFFDTAGLRATHDPIEAQGVSRAHQAIGAAELVITVVDGSVPLTPDARSSIERTATLQGILFANKLDLGSEGSDDIGERLGTNGKLVLVAGSVRWPKTVEEIRAAIARLGWGGRAGGDRAVVANARQIEALTRAREALAHAAATLSAQAPCDLASPDLRDAIAAYGEVTGDTVTEEVLDGIFSRFCVGK
ncbi:MAG TPA: tRNA uridine-5-carboxymethylaminomethyl(34) synthesis GTPase MnmE [Candidatus Acidoferrales bacterium]|nr:tRNA uridine-5-carboxymethylaminomethyl(34) synthesis GTPase MnmE [Candidatus Acidoferrales bacterium]